MKPRGRPPLDPADPSIDVHFRLPSKQYDEAFRHAQEARLTVPEWIRRKVAEATGRPFRDSK